MSAAIRHVSVRVPWHDRAWDGHVCNAPGANSSCLALKLIAEGRNDAVEADIAGQAIDDLPYDKAPPCIKASAGFLSGRPQTFQSVMSYSRWSDSHSHMKPKTLHLPAYGAQLIPYRWMLRESGFPLAAGLELTVDPEREPKDPEFLQNTAWVQHHDHQRELLEAFSRPLAENQSLVLFYATRTPICDDERRVILGAALLEKKHGIFEYDYEPAESAATRLRAMVWERTIQHSLRPIRIEGEATRYIGGFLLPYHDILKAIDGGASLNAADYVAFAPEDARPEFSYGSEHVSHGPAAAALLAARDSFERVAKVLDGPWAEQIAWIDDQLSRLWKLRGPAPGLGVALSVLHKGFNGTLFAIALADQLVPGDDPWTKADVILSGNAKTPSGAPAVTSTLSKRWNKLKADPKKYDALRLLARLELTKDQAQRAWSEIDPAEILDNPYCLYERDRAELEPVSFEVLDRGLFPGRDIAEAHPLPGSCPSDLSEHDNPKRLRAAAVHILEAASDDGHTLMTADGLADAADKLTLTRPLPFDADLLDLFRDDFSPVVNVGPGDDPTAQLDRYVAYKVLIENYVKDRVAATGKDAGIDWSTLLRDKFGDAGNDEIEQAARREKATALQRLATHRITTLIGPAGTGKTAVLELLLQRLDIVGKRVKLLAPTGKARVRLGASTGRSGEAETIAQFLLPLDRFEPSTGRYAPAEHTGPTEASCCVIDEASMLTEDMLAAVLDALPQECRLILVGDPYQLPPIGAGCPFVDIIAYLKAQRPDCVAELSVSMRQRGDRSDGRLAAIFSGRPLAPGEDEIAALTLDGIDDAYLRLRRWEKVSELPELLSEVLQEEFGNSDVTAELEKTLGAVPNAKGYLQFEGGCSDKAEAWQILTVNRVQPGGSVFINRHIKETYRQRRLNDAITSNQKNWRIKWFRTIKPHGPEQITYGDKVICVRNHQRFAYGYTNGKDAGRDYLANGEIGLVVGQQQYGHANPKHLNVEFAGRADRSFGFRGSDFKDDGQPFLELAYAVTVHKAQGSQFDVVMLVLPAGSRLLSREMIYTALTRQTKRVWILHQGGFENVLAYRHEAFSDVSARMTNLLRNSEPRPAILPSDLPPGMAFNARGFLEERLNHRTIRGELVSSKAELAIANILYTLEQEKRLTYEVEPRLPFTDIPKGRWADFRITSGGKTWFWEHCGMLENENYRRRWAKKLKMYDENGFKPWLPSDPDGRLIVTEDGTAHGLDTHEIEKMARKLFS